MEKNESFEILRKCNFFYITVRRHLESHRIEIGGIDEEGREEATLQISTKSDNKQRNGTIFTGKRLIASRHLGFDAKITEELK